MEYKYKIDVANIEDTETIVKFQLAMAKEAEGTELKSGKTKCIDFQKPNVLKIHKNQMYKINAA